MNDKSHSGELDQPTPVEINDENSPDETKIMNSTKEKRNSKGSPASLSKENENYSSNHKISSKTFSFTESSIKGKQSNTNKAKISNDLQNIKNKDDNNQNNTKQMKSNLSESKQKKNDDDIPRENSYNTNSTDSEVDANFSVSSKKSKNDQEFELKLFSATSSLSSFSRLKKVKYEVEQIKHFISQETKRLNDEKVELSINTKLRSEISLIACAPRCAVRQKLLKMGILQSF